MWQYILQFLCWLGKSFGNTGEVSGRRLTAAAVTAMYLYGSYLYHTITCIGNMYYQLLGIIVHATFILLLFGIVTAQQVIEFKNSNNLKPETKE